MIRLLPPVRVPHLAASFLLALAVASTGPAQTLIKDLRPGQLVGSADAQPRSYAVLGDRAYFAANSSRYTAGGVGEELWTSDGTEAGTHLVKDIYPGFSISYAQNYPLSSSPQELTVVEGGQPTLYFTALDERGRELWKSDGTPAGTRIVRELLAGPNGSAPQQLVAVGELLYFGAGDGVLGLELWRTDGTEAGTRLVKDIYAGPGHASPGKVVPMGSALYFAATDAAGGRELWRSDGTDAGTVRVKDIAPGTASSSPEQLLVFGGQLYFTAVDPTSGRELWRSDGTEAGTVPVLDLRTGPNSSDIENLTPFAGQLYFTGNDGVRGRELYRTDGTAAGTALVVELSQGSSSLTNFEMAVFQGALILGVQWYAPPMRAALLRLAPGSTSPTVLMEGVAGTGIPGHLTPIGTSLFFRAHRQGGALWMTDGTATGTAQLSGGFLNAVADGERIVLGSQLLFTARTNLGIELWGSDGTVSGTAMVKDIDPPAATASSPAQLTATPDAVYFAADDGVLGRELWRTDGTAAGTVPVRDIHPTAGSDPTELVAMGGTVFFVANDTSGTGNQELWKTTTVAPGAVLVRDIVPGAYGSSPRELTVAGGLVFFTPTSPYADGELWRSDGTTAGTVLVKDIRASGRSQPAKLTAVGSTIYFTADDGVSGRELWTSDGTPGGTRLVRDINPGASAANPRDLTAWGNRLFFAASDGSNGYELWSTDGTATGTAMVKDIAPGAASSGPAGLTVFGSDLYFSANGGEGYELWRSDGTAPGTFLVAELTPGWNGSFPQDLTVAGNRLFFKVAISGRASPNPWEWTGLAVSDGTTAGTRLLRDISASGNAKQSLLYLTAAGDSLFFTGTTNSYGAELWRSDGTVEGTRLAADIWPANISSTPHDLCLWRDKLLFAADDGIVGTELWKVALGATATPIGTGCSTAFPPPRLSASAPVLGTSLVVSVDGGRASTLGALLAGLHAEPPLSLGHGCTLYLGLGLQVDLGYFVTSATGHGSLSLPIPGDPGLIGVTLGAQAILAPTGNLPLGVDFTNGLLLTIDR